MNGGQLPKFRRPPLIEVVHGVQFAPLPMTIVHPGLFYSRIRDRYPLSQTVPSLAPTRESFDAAAPMMMFQFGLVAQASFPERGFGLAATLCLFNCNPIACSSIGGVLAMTLSIRTTKLYLRSFGEFTANSKRSLQKIVFGVIERNQCEMTYINHLDPIEPGAERPAPATLLRVWKDQMGPEWDVPLEDLAFTARYVLRGGGGRPVGRLTTTLATLVPPGTGKPVLQLELTAQGSPESAGLAGVLDIQVKSARTSRLCGVWGITEPEAHAKWERWR